MNAQQAHPSLEQLRSFAAGNLTVEMASSLSAHLTDCSSCRSQLDSLAPESLEQLVRVVLQQQTSDYPPDHATPIPANRTWITAGAAPPAVAIPDSLTHHQRYEVVGVLGRGGMGVVYRANHRLMKRSLALKVIHQSLLDRPQVRDRFRREIEVAASLHHPNIAAAYEAEELDGTLVLVMEYVEGQTLAQRVREQGPSSVQEACQFVRQAALGLQHAFEKGMVHRDLKPHNLMLTPQAVVKILDFGLARLTDSSPQEAGITDAYQLLGTPDYMAPEQAEDAHQADIRADIYSLGCTLYHLLAGRPPFPEGSWVQKVALHQQGQVPPLEKIRSDLPPALTSVLCRMLATKPTDRYQTPHEVAKALEPFTVPPKTPPKRWSLYIVAAVFLLALGLTGTLFRDVLGRFFTHPILFTTNHGLLVIETSGKNVEVKFKDGTVIVVDSKSRRSIELRAGEQEIEVRERPEGFRFFTKKFTLARGGREIVKVRFDVRKKHTAERSDNDLDRLQRQKDVPRKWRDQLPREVVAVNTDLAGEKSNYWSKVTISPDGRHILHSYDQTALLWDLREGNKRRFQGAAKDWSITALAFTPDGQHFALCGYHHPVKIFEVTTGKEVFSWTGADGVFRGLVFSPDGKRLLISHRDRHPGPCTLRLFDWRNKKQVSSFPHPSNVASLAFAPGGKSFLSGAEDGLRLWSVDQPRAPLWSHTQSLGWSSVAYSPDGQRVATTSMTDAVDPKSPRVRVRLWKVKENSLELSAELSGLKTKDVNFYLAFAPDAKSFVSASQFDGRVTLWSVKTRKQLWSCQLPAQLFSLAFAQDGRHVAVLRGNGTVYILRLPHELGSLHVAPSMIGN